jgi:hypothetical protein
MIILATMIMITLVTSLPSNVGSVENANLKFSKRMIKKIQPLPSNTIPSSSLSPSSLSSLSSSNNKPLKVMSIFDGLTNTTRDQLINRAHSRPQLVCSSIHPHSIIIAYPRIIIAHVSNAQHFYLQS